MIVDSVAGWGGDDIGVVERNGRNPCEPLVEQDGGWESTFRGRGIRIRLVDVEVVPPTWPCGRMGTCETNELADKGCFCDSQQRRNTREVAIQAQVIFDSQNFP